MALTTVRQFRQTATPTYRLAANFADLDANAATIQPGDYIKVVTTGTIYLCTATAEFQPLSASLSGKKFQGVFEDFANPGVTGNWLAITDTNTSYNSNKGVTVFGQGLAETDSGVAVAYGVGGPVATVTATDEASHLTALGMGGTSTTESWDPATYGPMVVEATVAASSALTNKAIFIGFIGTQVEALDPCVTGSTTTITLVQDDVHGILMDASLTDAAGLMMVYNKADAAASIATTATGVDTGVDMPTAGTYCVLKVQIDADGTMTCYKDGVQIGQRRASASTTVKLNPVLYVESRTTATQAILVKSFAAYAQG
jgi:hypothetical protein